MIRLALWEPPLSLPELICCCGASTAAAAPASIGSPRGVPVPCSSSEVSAAGARPAEAKAARSTSCWAGPLGAVRPLLRPSWFTELPRRYAKGKAPWC